MYYEERVDAASRAHQQHDNPDRSSANRPPPALIRQPDSPPISQEQLNAAVKVTYARLVAVEAECIKVDAAQGADPRLYLSPEKWQDLIALHRTLLCEHFQFFVDTQHPSAGQALRDIAAKCHMPARMWKHSIHAFLEVLRHRRPESQEYMLAFVQLSYEMIGVLLETVTSFEDTWLECLGDLARYRMAIAEGKEDGDVWRAIAARWYTMASDHHPIVGRFSHHLGLLEPMNLRKFCLYMQSLISVVPYPDANGSLPELCSRILHSNEAMESTRHSLEARIVTYHALVCSGADRDSIDAAGSHALELLHQQPAEIKSFGVYLAIANMAALFELGSPSSPLFQQYATIINHAAQDCQHPTRRTSVGHGNGPSSMFSHATQRKCVSPGISFFEKTFSQVMQDAGLTSSENILPYVHITLAALHSLETVNAKQSDNLSGHVFVSGVDASCLAWNALAKFLNTLAHDHPISARIFECARQRVFPARREDDRPLQEDFMLRGQIWTQFYFCAGWFHDPPDYDGRAIESEKTHQLRVERVLWLGLCWSFHSPYLHFDVHATAFSAPESVPPPPLPILHNVETAETCSEQTSDIPSLTSWSSDSCEEDDVVMVGP